MNKKPVIPLCPNIDTLVELYEDYCEDVFSVLKSYTAPPCRDNEIHNILVCTDNERWLSGHITAVVDIAKQLNEYGYRAILCFASTPPAGIADGMQFVVNPIIGKAGSSYRKRIETYRTICEEYNIDTVILNSWQGPKKYWDLLALQNLFPETSSTRIRVLLHFHSSFSRSQINIKANWLRDTTPVVHHFDALIVLSDVDKAFWQTFHPNVYSRPLPVEYDVNHEISPRNVSAKNVIYLARFTAEKNQEQAILAFHKVVKELPDAKLILVGDDPEDYKSRCQGLVASLCLEDSVEFREYVKGDEKKRLFQTATLALNTSKYEGFPQYIAEAKALGLPIVAYDLPNVTLFEGAEDNGVVLVPQDDTVLLADEIVRVLNDSKLQEELGKRALQHAQFFANFDYCSFWKETFDDLRSNRRHYEKGTLQQRVYDSLFDALFQASKGFLPNEYISQDTPIPQNYIRRLRWKKRYERSAVLAKEWGPTNNLFVAPDTIVFNSFAAAALAGSKGAPIMLVKPQEFSYQTKAELLKFGASTIFVIGGPKDVSIQSGKSFASFFRNRTLRRIIDDNTPKLAIAASQRIGTECSDTVIIVTQKTFKDALSIFPYAYASVSPILFTGYDNLLSEETLSFIQEKGFQKALIIGGPKIMPAQLEVQLATADILTESITRLAGSNEYKTSRVVAEWSMGLLPNGTNAETGQLYQYARIQFQPSITFSMEKLGIANTVDWQPAIEGAALCGKNHSVLLLVDENDKTNVSFIEEHASSISQAYLFTQSRKMKKKSISELLALYKTT